ncbi:MAG: winged helix-turn-helix transcriptional regulator [Actinomycetota bacterium]|nr:winged helix-turn-helix transcriptional regulator [Actinomycetota bacterium]
MKAYGQYCPIAKALDVVGERWTLLLVRELTKGPARFVELRRSFPRLTPTVLTQRLRDMEAAGLVEKRRELDGLVRYGLTRRGGELDGVLVALGTWGARHTLGPPSPDDDMVPEIFFRSVPSRIDGTALGGGSLTVWVLLSGAEGGAWTIRVDRGGASVLTGEAGQPDVVFRATTADWMEVHVGRKTLATALADGTVQLSGDACLAERFAGMIRPQPWQQDVEPDGRAAGEPDGRAAVAL